jgi:hypothetical protein
MSMDAAHRNVRCNVDDMRGETIKRAANENVVTRQISRLVRAAPTHDRLFGRERLENMRKRINPPFFFGLKDKTFQDIGLRSDSFFFPRFKIRHNPSFAIGRSFYDNTFKPFKSFNPPDRVRGSFKSF